MHWTYKVLSRCKFIVKKKGIMILMSHKAMTAELPLLGKKDAIFAIRPELYEGAGVGIRSETGMMGIDGSTRHPGDRLVIGSDAGRICELSTNKSSSFTLQMEAKVGLGGIEIRDGRMGFNTTPTIELGPPGVKEPSTPDHGKTSNRSEIYRYLQQRPAKFVYREYNQSQGKYSDVKDYNVGLKTNRELLADLLEAEKMKPTGLLATEIKPRSLTETTSPLEQAILDGYAVSINLDTGDAKGVGDSLEDASASGITEEDFVAASIKAESVDVSIKARTARSLEPRRVGSPGEDLSKVSFSHAGGDPAGLLQATKHAKANAGETLSKKPSISLFIED